MLAEITPLILTYNEAPNIGQVLDRLQWAKRVVVVDSGSDDATERIAKGYPNVDFLVRAFDTHANQWNFGLRETGIRTEWILALDADYVVPDKLLDEIRGLKPEPAMAGFRARFRYCMQGVPLRGAAYTPVTVLFRRELALFWQDGHTQRVRVDGTIGDLRTPIDHDDRKSLERWFSSQIRYMQLESAHLLRLRFSEAGFADKVRKMVFPAPFLMFFYCLFVKGNVLDGRAGLLYALQRTVAEVMLSAFLLEAMLAPGTQRL
ncbi:MAG: glycosyltransferase family 2 protein [Betaproteobacteria bacterium]